MIGAQVAGKAARDTLFLSSFDVSALPYMMAASAAVSLVAVLWLSRMIVRHSPAKVVPACFAISGVALLVEWAISFPAPRVAAVAVNLHNGLFGAAVVSGFWSLINEKFDPRSGKRAVTWIGGGGTFGGVLGGVAAWGASAVITVATMLPLLAVMNFICLCATLLMRPPPRPRAAVDPSSAPHVSPFRILRDTPYLRNLSLVVGLGAITSGFLDFVFSAEAVKSFAKGPELLSFFSLFWLSVAVLSFAAQTLIGRVALEKLGLAATLALLPGFVVLGGAIGLLAPGLWSTIFLRGGEAVQRNSIYRAAYELLYTPLAEQKKRATKTLIDVGVDRLGVVASSGLAMLTLRFWPERAETILLAFGVACALLTLSRVRLLHAGYVTALKESLQRESQHLGASSRTPALPTQAGALVRDEIGGYLEVLPRTGDLAVLARSREAASRAAAGSSKEGVESLEKSLHAIVELCSGSPARARRMLNADAPLAAPLVSFAILLLADEELHLDAMHALQKVAPDVTGQLTDALCKPSVRFEIRKRIARVLAACPTPQAAEGLIRGTQDDRFEVRYECGRALLKITAADKSIEIARATVIAMVKREVMLSKEVWQSQPDPDLDDEASEPPALINRLLRDRLDRSMEHIFGVLALHLDRDSLRIAFAALHREDLRLRGTALEYLETVLPDEIREDVWPFLGEVRPMRPARPPHEILDDLIRARDAKKEAS